jgi:hypothetical protein
VPRLLRTADGIKRGNGPAPGKKQSTTRGGFDRTELPVPGQEWLPVCAERPLICRLFGTTPRLACPNGNRPVDLIDQRIEQRIYRFFAATRQVLV